MSEPIERDERNGQWDFETDGPDLDAPLVPNFDLPRGERIINEEASDQVPIWAIPIFRVSHNKNEDE